MDRDLFKRITHEMAMLGVEEVGPFLIGEPFIDPVRLVEAVRWLKQIKIPYVFVTSNATIAGMKYVKKIYDAGLDSLKWSCNWGDKSQFEEYTGVSGNVWENAQGNIKMAWEVRLAGGYTTHLYASSIDYGGDHRQFMEPYLRRYVRPYVDEHYWLPLYSMGGLSRDREKELQLKPIAGNQGKADDPVDPIPCWTLFTAAHIMADGRMTACCADAVGDWVVGDLNTQSFMECWHSPKFQELRAAHLKGDIIGTECEKCVLY